MIKVFIERWENNKDKVREELKKAHPENYLSLVKLYVEAIKIDDEASGYDIPTLDPERITEIDDGNYQGNLLYIIGERGFQPSQYYAVYVSYGSCSGCDTLQGIRCYTDETPSEDQVNQYMQLILNIVQGIKAIPNGCDVIEEI